MSSGKTGGGGAKDYYGHIAGIVCQGQLDFIWGLMLDNDLGWPSAKAWDLQVYGKGRTIIYTPNGNVYRTSERTEVDPIAFPWVLYASPWVAGSYAIGVKVLKNGHVWESAINANNSEPEDDPPADPLDIRRQVPVNNWIYISTPDVWAAPPNYWAANSIVAHEGRIYTTAVGTKAKPPAAPWVLWKIDRATSANPLKFTVEGHGDAYLYWGTSDQTLDGADEAILTAMGHPAYRNRAVLVLKNFLFGTGRVSPPNIVLLGGRKPVQNLIAGAATDFDADWQVNPWGVLAEKLSHPVIGLGLPASWFNAAAWQAEADRCAANPQLFYISPMYTALKKTRELVPDLLSYPDSFIRWSVVAALLTGHFPHGEAAPAFTAATTIDRNDLVAPPEWSSKGWGGTSDSATVSFNDVKAAFKSRPVTAANLFNRSITRRVKTTRFDRPHIVRFDQASAWATEFAKIAGEQFVKGTFTVRAEKASAITPGSIFLFTDDDLQISLPMRCTKKVLSAPPAGTVKLSFESERGLSPQPYSPTLANPTPTTGPSPAAIKNARFVQIPAALGTGANQLACLATRTNEFTSAFEIWYQQADLASWQLITSQAGFAVAGIVQGSINFQGGQTSFGQGIINQGDVIAVSPDIWNVSVTYEVPPGGGGFVAAVEGTDYLLDPDAGTVTIVVGGGITNGSEVVIDYSFNAAIKIWDQTIDADFEAIIATLTEDEIRDGKLLLFLIQKDNPELFEVCSVRGVVALGPNYGFRMRRAQFGTLSGGDGAHVWDTDDLAFIIFRDHLLPLSHESFRGLQKTNSSVKFRLAPQSAWVSSEIADLYDPATNPEGLATEWPLTFNNIYAPQLTYKAMQKNDVDVADWTIRFITSDTFKILAELSDKNKDLAHVAFTLVKADEELQVFSRNYDPTDYATAMFTFKFPKDGLWKIRTDILDHSGNQATYFFPSDGAGIRVDDANNTSDSPFVYAYNTHGNKIKNLRFGLFRDNAFTVHYQVKNRGTAPDAQGAGGGVWSTVTATTAVGGKYKTDADVPPFDKRTKTLYAYTSHAGLGNSTTVQFNL